ncbi:cell division protein ZapE [Neptunomonas phycophila]|uniref:Cell division protein ZapE n=1 Tax=Neptunomonas phycophila TaxID=1572645 RepID=A0ABT9EPN9_9GAMM|nr:cell division protein ZapE [Neptunomonas phycophila]MDP2521031.1 cell division protein ZapE [Neptunomonas phycophila]
MPASPLIVFEAQLLKDNFARDPVQLAAVKRLDDIHTELTLPPKRKGLWGATPPVKGLYMWGDVGRGKTFLMDLFYDSLPEKGKLRMHFYQFMMHIHAEMRLVSGQKNPLDVVARRLAKRCRVLCFDEFFVTDIGDAILLGGLLKTLFESGVTLITTSNIPVRLLFMDDLHKHKFDPARALLQQYMHEFHLDGKEDHRLRHMELKKTFFKTHEVLPDALFDQLNQNAPYEKNSALLINHRQMIPQRYSGQVVWFDFNDICSGPRAPQDYVELANKFSTVLITGVHALGGEIRDWIKARGTEDGSYEPTETGNRVVKYARLDDAARRFIALVDELYDRRVNLYLVADVAFEDLYGGGALSFEFARTHSRLIEMQSLEYLNQTPIHHAV